MCKLGQVLCLVLLFPFWLPSSTIAQFDDEVVIPETVVTYQVRLEPSNPRPGEHARIIADLQIHPDSGWHVFSVIPSEDDFAPIPTSLTFEAEPLILFGPVYESNPITAADPVLDMVLSYHEKKATLFQNMLIPEDLSGGTVLSKSGKLRYQACSDRVCLPPKTNAFSIQIPLGTGSVRTE